MVQKTAATKPKAVTRKECGSCGEIFTGAACSNCGEKINVFPINKEGIPIADVANAIGGTGADLPITLRRSPDSFDLDNELDLAVEREFKETLRSASLDKVKAMRAEQAAKRLRAEGELDATKRGFAPVQSDEPAPPAQPPGGMQQPSMNSAMLIQALGGWTQDARDQLFERLRSDQDFALNFSRMVNPQPQMPQFGMMNPNMMMGGMMPPQAPAEPPQQIDPVSMVSAMIAGMKSLQDLGGGNNNNDRLMDQLTNEIAEMRKETTELRNKLIEAQTNKPNGLTAEGVQIIVSDALARNSESHANIQEGVKVIEDLKSLSDGMADLGLMQKISHGDDRPSLDQQRLDHEIKMDDKREARDHELNIAAERSRQAESDTKGALLNNLLAAVPREEKEPDGDGLEKQTPIIDEDVVGNRRATVVS